MCLAEQTARRFAASSPPEGRGERGSLDGFVFSLPPAKKNSLSSSATTTASDRCLVTLQRREGKVIHTVAKKRETNKTAIKVKKPSALPAQLMIPLRPRNLCNCLSAGGEKSQQLGRLSELPDTFRTLLILPLNFEPRRGGGSFSYHEGGKTAAAAFFLSRPRSKREGMTE